MKIRSRAIYKIVRIATGINDTSAGVRWSCWILSNGDITVIDVNNSTSKTLATPSSAAEGIYYGAGDGLPSPREIAVAGNTEQAFL